MSRKARTPHPTQGPFYLVSLTGGTTKTVGPQARIAALTLVKNFGMRIVTVEEWRKARKKQQKEEPV